MSHWGLQAMTMNVARPQVLGSLLLAFVALVVALVRAWLLLFPAK